MVDNTGHDLRKTGIDIIGDVPWGTHFCQFYQDKQDLIDTLVPYFTAGLRSNEFCMWVTSEPLGVEEATQALRKSVPDLDRRMARGQIEVIPHTEWYVLDGVFDQHRVLDGWVQKLDKALARGYSGLRLSGNTFWLEKTDWNDFTDYEEVINSILGNYRILALCTYSVDKCGASEVADVVANHEFAILKRGGVWTVIESSTVKQAKQSLQAALTKLEDTNEELIASTEELEAANEELRATGDELRREIDERKRVEKALQESEQRVRRKLDSILSPEGDMGDLELGDILDTPSVQSLMDSFYELVRIPMAIIDLKGEVLVGVGWQDICTGFHRVHPQTCKHCIESDTQLTAGVPPGEFRLYKCKNNMWDIATPIMIGSEHVGNLFSGQFFFDDEPLNYELFRSQAKIYGFNEKEYISALERVPRLSRKVLGDGMAFFVKLADMLSKLNYSNIKLARLDQQREDLYKREHHISEVLQGTLVPQEIPEELYGCKLAVRYQPALREAEIGGDFYDVFDLGHGKIGIIIGDVAGKGLRAAIRVAEARYTMRCYAYENPDPALVFTRTNDVLNKSPYTEGAMLTAFFAVIDTTSNTIVYANAGHEPPVVLGANCSFKELTVTGIPLGIMSGVQYTEGICGLVPGDRVIMITDGISEARADGIILFEKQGVIEYLVGNLGVSESRMAAGLLEAATAHAGGQLQDDAAVVVFSPHF